MEVFIGKIEKIGFGKRHLAILDGFVNRLETFFDDPDKEHINLRELLGS